MSLDTAKLGGPYRTVFDVGAFRGDFARACLAEWPECGVESFEPLEERQGEGDPRWAWHRVALGARPAWTTMTKCVFVPSSSMLPMAKLHEDAFPYTKGGTEVGVPMETVDEYDDLVREPEELYEGAPTPDELAAFLTEAGFHHVRRVDELSHPKRPRRLLQTDELWTR